MGRPHGLDGSFHVTRPRPALLALGGQVQIGGDAHLGEARLEIVRRAGTDHRPILRLRGIDTRAGAEALRGRELLVDRAAAPALEEDEYWAEDLLGCRVVTVADVELGVVAELRALPSCEVLEVGGLLVPMVADAVLDVDVEGRRIVVDAVFLGIEERQAAPASGSAPGDAALRGDAASRGDTASRGDAGSSGDAASGSEAGPHGAARGRGRG